MAVLKNIKTMSEQAQPMKVKYVVERKSWFYGFFQALLAVVIGGVVTSIFSMMIFFGVLGALSATGNTPAVVTDHSILRIDLSSSIEERGEDNPFGSLLGGNYIEAQGLDDILAAIKEAKTNAKIEGIYLDGGVASTDIATLQEIRKALEDFKTSGKFILAYADIYGQSGYYLASVADKVMMNPSGMFEWRGMAAQPIFYKEVLDKLGIDMQVFRVGTYKSAVEPFICTEMSDANRAQVQSYVDDIWANLCADVSAARGISVDSLNAFANEYKFLSEAQDIVDYGFVDTLLYADGVREELRTHLGGVKVKFVSPKDVASLAQVNTASNKVAVYYAYGDIVDEMSSGLGAGGAEIVGDKVVKDLDELMNDDAVKAVVLRINSGGGSAYASEQMWKAIELLKAKKPVVVSMGGLAASGGYYMSCNANRIFSEPTTLTGSIGIFGMVPNFSNLLTKKLGLHFDVVKTNEAADFGAMGRKFNAKESAALQAHIERGYDLFLTRVANGRGMTKEAVNEIAQGRVWTGQQALGIGLVDELGTLDDAVAYAAQLAEVTDYAVANYPAKPDFVTQLLDAAKDNYMEREVRSMMGVFYPMLPMMKQIEGGNYLQARMPYLPNLK
jgi:protease-4